MQLEQKIGAKVRFMEFKMVPSYSLGGVLSYHYIHGLSSLFLVVCLCVLLSQTHTLKVEIVTKQMQLLFLFD